MKKSFFFMALPALALMFSLTSSAQQTTPVAMVSEEVSYELPAMVSEKTVPLFDDAFSNMPGVKVNFYCYNLNMVVLTVDRAVQKNNAAIEQKMHSIFNTTNETLPLQGKKSVSAANLKVMCNEADLITR